MVDKNDTLLREVDDELRRERMEKLWAKYGIYLLSAAALLVALVGGWKVMEQRARSQAEAGGAKYESAMALARAGKEDEAAKAFDELAKGKQAGYAALAELKLAGSHLKSGRPKDAFDAFESLSAKSGIDPMIKGFAQVQAASLRLGEADFTEMKNRLTPLGVEGSPWRLSANELLGTAAYKAGKLSEARALLLPLLSDPVLPRSSVERVTLLLTAITTAEQAVAAPKVEAPAAVGSPSAAKEDGAPAASVPPVVAPAVATPPAVVPEAEASVPTKAPAPDSKSDVPKK
jgi:hypothetical protein